MFCWTIIRGFTSISRGHNILLQFQYSILADPTAMKYLIILLLFCLSLVSSLKPDSAHKNGTEQDLSYPPNVTLTEKGVYNVLGFVLSVPYWIITTLWNFVSQIGLKKLASDFLELVLDTIVRVSSELCGLVFDIIEFKLETIADIWNFLYRFLLDVILAIYHMCQFSKRSTLFPLLYYLECIVAPVFDVRNTFYLNLPKKIFRIKAKSCSLKT